MQLRARVTQLDAKPKKALTVNDLIAGFKNGYLQEMDIWWVFCICRKKF